MNKLIVAICCVFFIAGDAAAGEATGVAVERLAKTTMSWDGGALPNYATSTPEISILRIRIAPGVQLPMHNHPVINAGVLLSGQLTVVTEDNKTLHLKAGQAIVEVVNKWHSGKNEGDDVAEIIVFYAGAIGTPLTVERQATPQKD